MRGRAALFFASVVMVAACYSGPGVDHYEDVLDSVLVPPEWTLVKDERRGPGEAFSCEPLVTPACPGIGRWYVVPWNERDSLNEIIRAVEAAGFSVDEVMRPECDRFASPTGCVVRATHGAEDLFAWIFPPGAATGMESREDQVVVQITVQR